MLVRALIAPKYNVKQTILIKEKIHELHGIYYYCYNVHRREFNMLHNVTLFIMLFKLFKFHSYLHFCYFLF